MAPTVGVLVMAYGSPASLDQLEAYYTHIRRGRPPEPAQLDELRGRYEAIGGISPLLERTRSQQAAIGAALDEAEPGRFTTALGQKHAEPFIEDGAATLAAAGVETVVGVVLAPHYSGASVRQYHERAAATVGDDLDYRAIDHWYDLPELTAFLAAGLVEARASVPERHKVLFTAHSLPERALAGDPYPDQLHASAAAVAEAAGLLPWGEWGLAWQSAGRTPEPWRGPDVLDVLAELAATGRSDGVVVCPQGFTADHLEVLYDLDIEARARAEELGLAFARTRSVNDDGDVMAGLARSVRRAADSTDGDRP